MEKVMNREDQKRAPIYEALEKFRKQRVVPVSYTHLRAHET